MHYIWCSRPPNSERDITDTQSRDANRKSHITLICRRAFQIWRITDIDKLYKCRNNSIISIAIFHDSSVGLSYSLVCTCFSFFISIELVTKRNRYICVSICLMFIVLLFICLWALQYDHSPRRPAISEAILGGPPFLKKSCHCSWTHIIK